MPLQLSQANEAHVFKTGVVRCSLRRSKRALAAPREMAFQPLSHVPVDLMKDFRRMPIPEVVAPASQVLIEFLYERRYRLVAHAGVGHLTQFSSFAGEGLFRWEYVQVFMVASTQVAVKPERVSQEVQPRAFLAKIHHARFVPIQLQAHPDLPASTQSTR